MRRYTSAHAKSGLKEKLPTIECWENQIKNEYTITLIHDEFTCVCPRTGLPDFGTIKIEYIPDKLCIETKSLKIYLNGYRNLGIFQENVVNKILKDIVQVCKPKSVTVTGEFHPRGGIKSVIVARGGQ